MLYATPLLALLFALALSLATIPVVWRFAPQLGLMDSPNHRKVHKAPIARVGGWGIATAIIASVFAWLPWDTLSASYVFGALVLTLFGVLDDRLNLGHYRKFIGQLIAVIPLVFYADIGIERVPFFADVAIPDALSQGLTVVAIMGMINAMNHADGLDGLAGGQALLSLVGIATLALVGTAAASTDGIASVSVVAIVSMASIGGILGFLRFNTHPAKVFMGDVGSQLLGFTLAFLVILLTQRENPSLTPAIAGLLLGIPLVDITAVLYLRIRNGMNWFVGSRNHIHHRLLDRGFSHRQAVVTIYGVQTTLVLCAIAFPYHPDLFLVVIYTLCCGLLLSLITLAENKQWRLTQRTRKQSHNNTRVHRATQRFARSIPTGFLVTAVPAYFLLVGISVASVPADIGAGCALLVIALAANALLRRKHDAIINRLVIYSLALFTLYLETTSPIADTESYAVLEPAYFVLVAIAIVFALRFSGPENFRHSPLDFLVAAAMLTFAFAIDQFSIGNVLGHWLVKAFVILYACELAFEHFARRWTAMRMVCLGSVAILCVRGLVSG